jgi:two-component system LytT family sensor kinase
MHATLLAGKNLKRPGSILLRIWLALLLYLIVNWLVMSTTDLVVERPFLQTMLRWTLNLWLPWLLLLPLMQIFLARFAFVPEFTAKSVSVYLGGLLLVVVFHTAIIAAGWFLRAMVTDAGISTFENYAFMLNFFMWQNGFILFDAAIFALLAASSSVHTLKTQLRAKELDAFKLSRSLTDSRLQTLKMQLNPHFLFNSLNGVSVLIDKSENARARDMLGELSSFLRQTLRNPKEKWVSLAKELEFVKMYLNIEQYRFGKRLTYFEECEPLALEAKLPPMLLQPLFENAIVHGLADKQGPCRLSFECRLYDRYLIMLIFDNGENFNEISDPLHKGGIGLSNIQDRLREVYGDNYSLSIEKKSDGTLVTLKVPSYKDSHF